PISPVRRDRELPLSFSQQRLWFLDRLEPGTPTYNLHVALQIRGHLDQGALARALELLVFRHEALRTTFAVRDGEPVQVIEPAGSWRLDIEDLNDLDARGERKAFESRMQAAALMPFDLERGPLFRGRLWRLDPRRHVLMLAMHHIVSDGW